MKIMISNGLRGKVDPKGYVEKCRAAVRAAYPESELINTFFEGFNGNRPQFLGKSIMDGAAIADLVVFMDDWHNYDGCRVEQFVCAQYKVPCAYLSTGQ
jgi:hypothetical protein